MTRVDTGAVGSLAKLPTGVEGLDEITRGGLPSGRVTLISGGPGSGKTVLALQLLAYGARERNESAVFVAFEEPPSRLVTNAAGFGWDLASLIEDGRLVVLDARLGPDLVASGGFDLQGLLAMLDAHIARSGATRVVLDSIDRLLVLLDDTAAERREIQRLDRWLQDRDITAIVTGKTGPTGEAIEPGFLPFVVDCVIHLSHQVVFGVSQRHLRVIKYRGSGFAENGSPMVFGTAGIELAGAGLGGSIALEASQERVSSGISRLDTMLGGGYYRGSSILVTGAPGTAKTTLSGAFLESICRAGQRALWVTYDSEASEIVRNLASVGIRLADLLASGVLRIYSTRASANGAEVHLRDIRQLVRDHQPDAIAIDPLSGLAHPGLEDAGHGAAERLIDWAKARGITVFCTSLLAANDPHGEGTPLAISTVADSWLHLSYVVEAGERNRLLTIVKSRGSAHSNQVRELVLSADGITLADVYTASGRVLMGTMRLQHEQAEQLQRRSLEAETRQRHLQLQLAKAEIEGRLGSLGRELELKAAELAFLHQQQVNHQSELESRLAATLESRGGGDSGEDGHETGPVGR